MIVKQEAGDAGNPQVIGKVKLVQSMISSFFPTQKTDTKPNVLKLVNKEIASVPLSRKKITRKARKTQSDNASKTKTIKSRSRRKQRAGIISQSIETVIHDNTPDNSTKQTHYIDSKLIKYEAKTDDDHINQLALMASNTMNELDQSCLKSIVEADKNLSIEANIITIKVEDSDSDNNIDQLESTSAGKSPSKRTNVHDENGSPNKKIKQELMNEHDLKQSRARKALFHDQHDGNRANEDKSVKITDIIDIDDDDDDNKVEEVVTVPNQEIVSIKSDSAIFDEDTSSLPDLNDYGVNVSELEAYTPSMCDTSKLNTSTPNITNQSLMDISVPTVSIKQEIIDLSQVLEVGIQTDNKDNGGGDNIVQHEVDVKASTSTQSCFTTKFEEEEEEKPNLEQLSMKTTLVKAWEDMQGVPSQVLGDYREILKILFSLESDYQKICVRLFARRTKWQRLKKFILSIRMSEERICESVQLLERLAYIHTDFVESEPLETILSYLTVPELKYLARIRRIKLTKWCKPDIMAALTKFCAAQPSIGSYSTEENLRANADQCIGGSLCLDSVMRNALFRLQLLYHCAIPDITSHYEFYLYMADLDSGSVKLPEYKVHEVCAFDNAEVFERYATAMEMFFNYSYHKEQRSKNMKQNLLDVAKLAFSNLKEVVDLPLDISPVHRRFTAEYVYAKILTLAATDLTTFGQEVTEWLLYLIEFYRGTKRAEWYDRLAMNLKKQGDKLQAEEVIRKALLDKSFTGVDRFTLAIRATAVNKSLKLKDNSMLFSKAPQCTEVPRLVIEAKPQKISKYQGHRLLFEKNSELFTVEEIAIKCYNEQGYSNGIHCEGALLMTLFAAIFWDIIYADVPSEHPFISRLQYIPLDLFSKEFYLRRKLLIDRRLGDVSHAWDDDKFFRHLQMFHVDHSHEKSVHDPRLSGDVILEAAACIGREKLGKMLERLVKDPRQYRAGMPDLFVWDYASKKCNFVEVKSHNDVLSLKQKLWLEFLHEIEVPVELCLVNSSGEKVSKARTKQL